MDFFRKLYAATANPSKNIFFHMDKRRVFWYDKVRKLIRTGVVL